LKSTFDMVSESILVRLLDLSGHLLSGSYSDYPYILVSRGDPTRYEAFQWFISKCKPQLTSQFCKVELSLKFTSDTNYHKRLPSSLEQTPNRPSNFLTIHISSFIFPSSTLCTLPPWLIKMKA